MVSGMEDLQRLGACRINSHNVCRTDVPTKTCDLREFVVQQHVLDRR